MRPFQWLGKIVDCFTSDASSKPVDNRAPLAVETLEDRLVLTTNIDPASQLMIELINRARLDPAAEAARYGINLNEGLAAGTISTTAKQALAPNQQLANAIQAHVNYLFNNNVGLTHTGAGGTTLAQRLTNAGYDYTTGGENLAYASRSPSSTDVNQIVTDLHKLLFVDAGISGRGHRTNMLNNAFKEIGAGTRSGSYAFAGFSNHSVFVGQNLGARNGNSFLTGVAFTDGVVADDFYTIGEALGGVTIQATRTTDGAVFSVQTGAAGGYALQLAAGTYNIVASGGGLDGPWAVNGVQIGSSNVKLDFNKAEAPRTPVDNLDAVHSLTGDFDGDGKDEILGVNADGQIWVADGDSGAFVAYEWAQWSSTGSWHSFHVGDFNGDGRDDLAGFGHNGTWWVGFSNGTTFQTKLMATWSGSSTWDQFYVGDFNGSGRDDVLGFGHNGTWWIGASTGSAFNTGLMAAWSNSSTWDSHYVGDFNGDGRDDILGFGHNGTWWIGASTGSAFNTGLMAAWSNSSTWDTFVVGDFTGDGRDDIAGFGHNGTWWVGASTGSSFVAGLWAPSGWSNSAAWDVFAVGDFNNDGRDDVMGFGHNGTWQLGKSVGNAFAASIFAQESSSSNWKNYLIGNFAGSGNDDVTGLTTGAKLILHLG